MCGLRSKSNDDDVSLWSGATSTTFEFRRTLNLREWRDVFLARRDGRSDASGCIKKQLSPNDGLANGFVPWQQRQ